MLTYRPVTEFSDLNLFQPKCQICVLAIIHFSNTESGQVTFFKNVECDSPACITRSQEQCTV